MPRVVALCLPFLPTDRIRRADALLSVESPIAVIARSGSKRTVTAADHAALKAGVRVGMAASKAQAMIVGLHLVDADPVGDEATVHRLALWVLRQYTPIVATDLPDGIVLDTEGADHLRGGEEVMLSGLVNAI